MKRWLFACVAVLALGTAPATALEIEGIDFPDTTQVGGRTVRLVGGGLREVTFLKVDVYAGAMYAETKSCDLSRLAEDDQARLFRMDFLRDIPADKLYKNMRELMDVAMPAEATPELRKRIETFTALFRADARKGMRVDVRYVPGEGTAVQVDGRTHGPVFAGADFARVVFRVWFGPKPCCPGLLEGIRKTCR